MPNKERYWAKGYLLGALILAAYGIATAYWSAAQGEAYRKRELDRDKRFHAMEHEFEEFKAGIRAKGVTNLESDPTFAAEYAKAKKAAADLNREAHDDFNGKKALVWSAIGGAVVMGTYFFGAVATWRRKVHAAQSGLAPSTNGDDAKAA